MECPNVRKSVCRTSTERCLWHRYHAGWPSRSLNVLVKVPLQVCTLLRSCAKLVIILLCIVVIFLMIFSQGAMSVCKQKEHRCGATDIQKKK